VNRSLVPKLLRAWPFFVLAVLSVVFVLMLVFSRKAPVIATLEPEMAAPGQQVVISGDYFGRTEREGSLSIAGEIPPPSLIQSWTDQRIVFIVPEDASSGLVTVANSQGTSTGVLFTNTESIPTVLQAPAAQGGPLLLAIVPAQPQAGQTVTLTGRGMGSGESRALVRLTTGLRGPVFDLSPSDCVFWSDRSISFRWPTGAGPGSSVQVVTPRGGTGVLTLEASSPVVYEDPRTLVVQVQIGVTGPAGMAAALWGPVPQAWAGTAWTLESALPPPLTGPRPLVFRWSAGSPGERQATYVLKLTTWARRWEGFPAGVLADSDAPKGDGRPLEWWKPGLPALKTLTAKWGLETSDPWLRVQRIQTGLAGAFSFDPVSAPVKGLGRPTAEILAIRTLNSLEASSLVAALAGQTGIPTRLVTGLWLDPENTPRPRVWVEAWLAGAGWVPWDPIEGGPGNLDNRHFAFEVVPGPLPRLEPGAKLLTDSWPLGQGEPVGEAVWTSQEPVVQWQITRTQK